MAQTASAATIAQNTPQSNACQGHIALVVLRNGFARCLFVHLV